MNTKTIIAGLLTGVVNFLLGWLIMGVLLMSYYNQHMMHYAGMEKGNPDMLFLAIGSFAYALLMAYVFVAANINSVAKGWLAGAIIAVLTQLCFDSFMYAQYNLFGRKLMLIDIGVNAVYGAILGIFLGWWLGRKKTKAV
ncbi:MAG: hypothetical protein JST94_04495 [Bacteroidetes bacterium]|nr:hypothetical protein [Bacteroidota bacterium]MBS1670700.1 hypothetical protein [Bacteroidota bacterium]